MPSRSISNQVQDAPLVTTRPSDKRPPAGESQNLFNAIWNPIQTIAKRTAIYFAFIAAKQPSRIRQVLKQVICPTPDCSQPNIATLYCKSNLSWQDRPSRLAKELMTEPKWSAIPFKFLFLTDAILHYIRLAATESTSLGLIPFQD